MVRDDHEGGSGMGMTFAPEIERYSKEFEQEGSVVIPGALDAGQVERLTDALERVYKELGEPGKPLHTLAFMGRDPVFLELLDLRSTLPLIVSVLGANIYCYHCHLDVHPPEEPPNTMTWMWHQDGGVQNRDLESDPRPRMSIKIAYFLTDVSEPGRGNFRVLPGSHVKNRIERPADNDNDIPGAKHVLASPGDAVMFDRRLWHMRSLNFSDVTRKALFLAYTFRWVRPRDDMEYPPEMVASLEPVQRQLLGFADQTIDHWMPDQVTPPVQELFDPRPD